MSGTYFLLKVFEFFRIKFNNVPAGFANHVVMMFVSVCVLKDISPFGSGYLFDKTTFDKQVQRAVNRCSRCFRASCPHPEIEMFRLEMSVKGEYLLQDRNPLLCEFQTLIAEKILEYLAFHGLIVTEIEIKYQFEPPAFSQQERIYRLLRKFRHQELISGREQYSFLFSLCPEAKKPPYLGQAAETF
jgi:hypothetical protein